MKSGDPHCNEELAVELARRDGEEGRSRRRRRRKTTHKVVYNNLHLTGGEKPARSIKVL